MWWVGREALERSRVLGGDKLEFGEAIGCIGGAGREKDVSSLDQMGSRDGGVW